MSLHRRDARRDANEAAIVSTLRLLGCSVEYLSGKGTPDLLIGFQRRYVVLAEVKTGKGELTDDQAAWHARWRGPSPMLLRSVDDALALVNRWVLGLSA
jgi:hypothetical protein